MSYIQEKIFYFLFVLIIIYLLITLYDPIIFKYNLQNLRCYVKTVLLLMFTTRELQIQQIYRISETGYPNLVDRNFRLRSGKLPDT